MHASKPRCLKNTKGDGLFAAVSMLDCETMFGGCKKPTEYILSTIIYSKTIQIERGNPNCSKTRDENPNHVFEECRYL